ncbi:MAG: 2-oxoglutarate dehydrogenase E1 component [Sphingobacteriales bacterium]|jgi:2-oxoglutarate dehydrogenase E1 component
MDKLSYLSNANPEYIDNLYQSFLKDPESVDFGWRKFFEGYEFSKDTGFETFLKNSEETFEKEIKVLNMVNGYRSRGHLFTKTNPVRERRKYYPGKELETFGLSEDDLDTVFQCGKELGLGPATLREIVAHIEQTYCQSIGTEFMYLRNPLKIEWFLKRFREEQNTPNFDLVEKKRILRKLNQAVVFENFLHTKYVGQKRFSLEGAESVIPALDAIIEKGAAQGIEEFVIGMAHRGRLNVLANILNKTFKEIFSEFEGKLFEDEIDNAQFGGDVKYHMGYASDVKTYEGKNVRLNLSPNPSHLEAVDPVVEGMVRAKIDHKYKGDFRKIAPILIHGDASIAGQGVVYEVAQMSKLEGYRTGGTIHLVINNQVGFTTNYLDGRSSTYCTDVAKVTLSPVFHVNGDDVEALVYAIQMAMEFRQEFHTDVYIDVLCYRKYGHNEGDEPRFTQPLLYDAIQKHDNPREVYMQKLIASGEISKELAKEMEKDFKDMLQGILEEAKKQDIGQRSLKSFTGRWRDFRMATNADFKNSIDTSISEKRLKSLGASLVALPENKNIFRKINKIFGEREQMLKDGTFDWAMGELLAYASLLTEGHAVRLSGQDCERGTFSHRHAVIKFEKSEEEYIPLANLSKDQAPFTVYNSFLSEYAVLGFEYGYAASTPNHLTIWEAQFGDFFNGAQVIIDQFLASAQTKWKKSNGLVMYLPHGYEGQGPEHSSARMERFLELCADNNLQIVNCTTPANQFHALRRQLKTDYRIPLIMFTPKSLLRHAECRSTTEEFTKGKFQEIIDDVQIKDAKKVTNVLFCQGKVYYDLKTKRDSLPKKDQEKYAIVRMEQIYPLPYDQLDNILAKYINHKHIVWVQEEARNMGAWPYISRKFKDNKIHIVSRKESGSPATGHPKQNITQFNYIMEKAFELNPSGDRSASEKAGKK